MNQSRRSARKSVSTKPNRFQLEELESRWLLACATNFDALTATLSVTCNGGADVVNIRDNGTGGITGDANGIAVGAEGAVSNVVINTGRGNDRVNYELQGSLGTPRNITIIADKGNDQINLDLCVGACNGEGGKPASINEDLSVNVEAGDGNDRVAAQFDEFRGITAEIGGSFTSSLGKGVDSLDVDLLGDLVSATVLIIGNGNAGADRMEVDALTDLVRGDGSGIDVANNSSLGIDLSGGNEIDKLDVRYSGIYDGTDGARSARSIKVPLDRSLDIQVDGGTDNDLLSVGVQLNSASTGSTNLDVNGSDGLDRLQLLILNPAGGEGGPVVNAAVDGGSGRDHAFVSQEVAVSKGTEMVDVVGPVV